MSGQDMELGTGATLQETLLTTLGPAVCMCLGSALISCASPSQRFQALLQHLSAGILIGAIIAEIFPILRSRLLLKEVDTHKGPRQVDWVALGAAGVGFFLALAVMYSVKALDIEDEDEEEPAKAESTQVASLENPLLAEPVEGNRMKATIKKLSTQSQALTKVLESGNIVDRDSVDEAVHNIEFLVDSARRVTRGSAPLDKRNVSRLKTHVKELEVDIQGVDPKRVDFKNVALVDQNLKKAAATLRHLHQHAHRGAWRKFAVRNPLMEEDRGDVEESKTPLSRALVLAVIIDAAVDGMLIGLASAVARTSGILMAIATSIEMGFLGYAFACAVVKSLKCAQAMVVLALPPLVMVFSSGVAAWSTDDVEQTPIFTGLIAFALVALLFLVVQELIVEAHEKEGGDLWYVSMFLYIGLVLSFAMDLVLQ